jgi:regulation of enolase protein 1 (concanavalin A-like superfamily)
MEAFRLAALPAELQWRLRPAQWAQEPDGGLSVTAGSKTDLFTDPGSGGKMDSAPAALFVPPDESFLLSARVEVAFGSTFDAGVLHAWVDGDLWAKLCFEFSPQGEPTIVSVVNRTFSDDCNSVPVVGASAFLRIAQLGRATAFHWSSDGKKWSLVRYFTLGRTAGLRVGFSSQSPTGPGCRSRFSQIRYRAGTLPDLRNGE